jgi:hypothetical protein
VTDIPNPWPHIAAATRAFWRFGFAPTADIRKSASNRDPFELDNNHPKNR